jgi:hypothetical protein
VLAALGMGQSQFMGELIRQAETVQHFRSRRSA